MAIKNLDTFNIKKMLQNKLQAKRNIRYPDTDEWLKNNPVRKSQFDKAVEIIYPVLKQHVRKHFYLDKRTETEEEIDDLIVYTLYKHFIRKFFDDTDFENCSHYQPKDFGRFNPEKNELNYYLKIIRRNANKIKKIKKKKRITILNLEDLYGVESNEKNPEKLFLEKERIDIIQKNINLLSYETRQIIYLKFFKKTTLKNISIILDIRYRKTSELYIKGKRILRQYLLNSNYHFDLSDSYPDTVWRIQK